MLFKDEKIKSLIKDLAGEFLQRESNRISLITVTNVMLLQNGHKALVLFTVMPEHKSKEALDFVKRLRNDFKEFVEKKARIGRQMVFDFDIDLGEKHRQKIDEALRKAE